jgi:hypothetical protein
LPEELARIGGKGLDVASLPLGVDGVEGQRGLPRTGEAGEDDQFVAGQLDREVLQVVLTGAPDGIESVDTLRPVVAFSYASVI